uniref:Uncharacterized protein n=1 Tax=Populus trichocarpa TaxID=3694 RepID=U5FWU3_POPTR
MKTGSAARCLRVLSPATIIKFRSIWWIFRSQFIVPFLVIMTTADKNRWMETASRRSVGRGSECLLAPLAYFLPLLLFPSLVFLHSLVSQPRSDHWQT